MFSVGGDYNGGFTGGDNFSSCFSGGLTGSTYAGGDINIYSAAGGKHTLYSATRVVDHNDAPISSANGAQESYYSYSYPKTYEERKLEREHKRRETQISTGKQQRSEGNVFAAISLFSQCKPEFYPQDKSVFQKEILSKLQAKFDSLQRKLQPIKDGQEEEKYNEQKYYQQNHQEFIKTVNTLKEGFSGLIYRYRQAVEYFELDNQFADRLDEIDEINLFLETKAKQLESDQSIYDALSKLAAVRSQLEKAFAKGWREHRLEVISFFEEAANACEKLVKEGYPVVNYEKCVQHYHDFSIRYQHHSDQLDRWNDPMKLFTNALKTLKGNHAQLRPSTLNQLNDVDGFTEFFQNKDAMKCFVDLTPDGMQMFQQQIQQWMEEHISEVNPLYHPSLWCSSDVFFGWNNASQIDLFGMIEHCAQYQKIDTQNLIEGIANEDMIVKPSLQPVYVSPQYR